MDTLNQLILWKVFQFRDEQTNGFYEYLKSEDLLSEYPPRNEIPIIDHELRFDTYNAYFLEKWIQIDKDTKLLCLSNFDGELCYAEMGPEY